MNSRSFLTILVAFFCFVTLGNAQKFGHLNYSELLLQMPEVKAADQELAEYEKTLMAARDELIKSFQANYDAYVQEVNSGVLSSVQMQQKEGALQQENQNIKNYETQVQEMFAKRKADLYNPIFIRVKEILDAVGAEHNFTMIFDTSSGALLHAIDSENVIELVKEKLGINTP